MVTVYTKEELAKAIENKTPIILCKGKPSVNPVL